MDEALHSYTVVLETRTYITVYAAPSREEAIEQAYGMVHALDDREVQHEMNHGHVSFEVLDDAVLEADHDPQCLAPEHDDDEGGQS